MAPGERAGAPAADEAPHGWRDVQGAQQPFPAHRRIHELFEEWVDRQPAATAIREAGRAISYATLERQSNRIAHALRERHGPLGRPVGVCCQRGPTLIAALLGVCKSGAPYVPLDPTYPPARLRQMIAVAELSAVITQGALRELLPAGPTLIDVDQVIGDATLSEARPAARGTTADPCYAIFTSGTTGEPKGVVMSHAAVVNTLAWVNGTFAVTPSDRLLFVTSPSFDLSVYDVFGTLAARASIVIPTTAALREPAALAALLDQEQVTIWNSAPAALDQLADHLAGRGSTLRLVLLSGDWIPLPLVRLLKAQCPGATVVALGGATEAAIWSNWFTIDAVDDRWARIPYGRPIQNVHYCLKTPEASYPATGELYIGGVCVADGYLNRPQLTGERFVADPFSAVPEARLFRTGDLARLRPDGVFELLGRVDEQVKIRGYRVELAEIDAALGRAPGVRAAAATTFVDSSGQLSLIGCLVPAAVSAATPQSVREYLTGIVPAYMVPSVIVVVDQLPTTAQGKIDRAALRSSSMPSAPALSGPAASPATAEVPASTDTGGRLRAIWCTLLSRTDIGPDDDFFSLGGHSLLAVRLIAAIKRELGVELPLSSVLESPTLAKMTSRLDGGPTSTNTPHLVRLNTAGRSPPLVLISGLGGYALEYRQFHHQLGPDQPVFALQSIGAGPGEPLVPHSIEELAAIYEPQVLAVAPHGPIAFAGFSFGALPAFELACRFQRAGRRIVLFVSLDGAGPGLLGPANRLRSHLAELRHLDADYLRRRMASLRDWVERWRGGADWEVVPGLRALEPERHASLQKLWSLQSKAAQAYRPSSALSASTPMLLVRADHVSHRDAAEGSHHGWRRHVRGDISILKVRGEHASFMASEENRTLISRAMLRSLT